MRAMRDKVVLVTGGGQGIGRAIAQLLTERGSIAIVAEVDAQAGREAGFPFVRCDVSSERSVRACVGEVLSRFGRLDGLVNNAGLADPADDPVEKLDLAAWNRRIGVNLTGVFLMAKHCVPHLRRARGAIVNIASTRALQSEPNTAGVRRIEGRGRRAHPCARHEPGPGHPRELREPGLDRRERVEEGNQTQAAEVIQGGSRPTPGRAGRPPRGHC